jgi:hypothetical protein
MSPFPFFLNVWTVWRFGVRRWAMLLVFPHISRRMLVLWLTRDVSIESSTLSLQPLLSALFLCARY